MTTQDIYAWMQMGLQIVIGGGIVVGVYRYFGILRRAIESQKATIEAQAEQMKAQSTVLQEFERLNKGMKEVISTVDIPAMLQRMQAYKELVDREVDALLKERARQHGDTVEQVTRQLRQMAATFIGLLGDAMPYVPLSSRMTLIESAELLVEYQQILKQAAGIAPDLSREQEMRELHDPAFLAYVQQRVGMPVKPDEEDFDRTLPANTIAEQAHAYRLAQASKLLRLYRDWKAGLT